MSLPKIKIINKDSTPGMKRPWVSDNVSVEINGQNMIARSLNINWDADSKLPVITMSLYCDLEFEDKDAHRWAKGAFHMTLGKLNLVL